MHAAPTLRVRLLGGLDLRLGEAPLPPLDSGRAESLLAYLLLHRDAPQPRQRLAFLLWPDSTEPQARTNLRHVLHTLRRALPDADRFLDVGAAHAAVAARRAAAGSTSPPSRQALADGRPATAAVEPYAGDLLEGSYDEWLLEERERLRELYLDALERLAALLDERGERGGGDPLRRAAPAARPAARGDLPAADARSTTRAATARGRCAPTTRARRRSSASWASSRRRPTREAYEALLPSPRPRRRPPRRAGAPRSSGGRPSGRG